VLALTAMLVPINPLASLGADPSIVREKNRRGIVSAAFVDIVPSA
jgi:hypothetical protein